MGLEAATFIDGLTVSWPLAGDNKSVGDDHIRLVKSVLKGTFPTASKAFYFPTATSGAANVTLVAADMNRTVFLSTAGGELTVALPTLAAGDAGWKCEIVKTTFDTNGITVSPPAGSIVSQAGATATIRVGVSAQPATFVWSGTSWFCYKPGVMIGATVNFDGSVPAGFMTLDGSVFNGTTFAELAAVLGTTTLKDKRGRVEIGAGTGPGLTTRVAGTNYGGETSTLVTANLPAYTPAGSVAAPVISTPTKVSRYNFGTNPVGPSFLADILGEAGTSSAIVAATASVPAFTGTPQGGTATPVAILQPSIGVNKIIRAC